MTNERAKLSHNVRLRSEAADEHGGESPTQASIRLEIAKAWLRMQNLRRKLVSASLFHDPAWDLFLELYVAQCEGRAMRVKAATFAMNVPATTANRWLDRLLEEGWIVSKMESVGTRRVVSFSEEGFARVSRMLDAALDRKAGLGRLYLLQ